MNPVVLTGKTLTPKEVYEVAVLGARVTVDPDALLQVKKANDFLVSEIGKHAVYGITTGFGPMASHIIGKSQLKDLQYNLIRSHAVGMGEPIRDEFVLAAMVDRTKYLLCAHSGVSVELVEHLAACINNRICPIIPEHGAVGTSGDLVQLAHIALALIGEGDVRYEGVQTSSAAVFAKLNMQPYELKPKEGIALINGTSVMTGISSILLIETENLINIATRSGALALELVQGLSDAFSAELHAVRPHVGQAEIAHRLRSLLSSSKLIKDRKELQEQVSVQDQVYVTPEHIQEVYSFRCIPQILGPILDISRKVSQDITVELNSVTDNPVIDLNLKMFLHGGNFHGDYIATAVDQLKIGLVKMTMLSERRINFFLNKNVNQTFTPFLNLNQPGLTLSLQGVQFVATSTTAQSQSLAYPHSLHSISTNADNQDVVSMGTDAALLAFKVLENAYTVIAIELLTLAQAVDLTKVYEQLSDSSKELFSLTRTHVRAVTEDRTFSKELNAFSSALRKKYTTF